MTRFSGGGLRAVFEGNPQLLEGGQTETSEVGIIEGLLNDPVRGQAPVTFARPGYQMDFLGIGPEFKQSLSSSAGPFPVLPVTQAHAATDPLIPVQDFTGFP